MEIIPELKELNLEDNEIKVYLACLSLGSAKVNEIAKKSELIRTTCYSLLKSLTEKGLVSTVLKDNITYFQAASPKQLIEILDEKKKKVNSILPKLEKMQEIVSTAHKVQIFEGKEGFKTVINDYVTEKNEVVKIIGSLKKWLEFSEVYSDIYYRKKKENNIKTQVIIDESEKEFIKNKKIANSEFRCIKNLETYSECFIYQDKIAFVSLEPENIKGVIIQNEEMNKLQTLIFDHLWKLAKP